MKGTNLNLVLFPFYFSRLKPLSHSSRLLFYLCKKIRRLFMETTRQSKVSRLLLKDLSEIFQVESRNLFGGKMISVTTVRISPDLGLAKVYLSIYPSSVTEETLKLVKMNTKSIRKILGNKVAKQLRIVPELAFFVDDSLDYIENISNLLS